MTTREDGAMPLAGVLALGGLPGAVAGVCDDLPFPDLPPDQFSALLHARLRRVMACENQLGLAIGAGLHRMQTDLPYARLGPASFKALCVQRYGFSDGHGRELVSAWRAGTKLPLIIGAFLAGELSSSKVRELVGVATPETEGGLLRLACGMSGRKLKALLKSLRLGEAVAELEADVDERERVRMEASAADAATIRGPGLQMVRTVAGIPGPEHELFHCLAMEASSEVEVVEEAPPAPRRVRVAKAPKRVRKLTLEAVRRLARKERASAEVEPLLELPDVGSARTVNELHAMMLLLVALWAMARWERTCLLALIVRNGLHRHASLGALAEELGLAPREVVESDALSTRAMFFPRLREALSKGLIAPQAAWMLLRVVVPQNEEEWLRRARVVSLKRLEAEVQYTWRKRIGLSDAEYLRFTDGALPPDKLSMNRLTVDWMPTFGVAEPEGACASERGETEQVEAKEGACALEGGDAGQAPAATVDAEGEQGACVAR